MTIKFENTKRNVPIVRFSLGADKEYYAILDTGSESTLFDMYFIKEEKENISINIPEEKMSIVGVSSSNEVPLINVSVPICFEGRAVCTANGLVLDMSHITKEFPESMGNSFKISALFGSDVLDAISAKVDFEKKELIIQ